MKNLKQHLTSKILTIIMLTALMISCSKDDSSTPPVNQSPIANAGDDREEEIGSVVKLDASASTDPDGDTITYNWSFMNRPAGSTTAIIGVGNKAAEFTMDKAGSYEITLKISDGKRETTDNLTIINKTPVFNTIDTETTLNLDDDLAQKGQRIIIRGKFFSEDVTENKVTLGGVVCDDLQVFSSGVIIKVPNDAVSGDLVVTVGSQSATWQEPIRIISFPVAAFVETNDHLEEQLRSQNSSAGGSFEIGTRFKPLVKGKVVGLSFRAAVSGDYDVTLWDVTTKTSLVTKTFSIPNNSLRYISLDQSISLESGKEYIITVNAIEWYLHIDEQNFNGNQFPKTYDNIELLSTQFRETTDTDYPDGGVPTNYIVRGADIVFAPDIE